MKILKVIKKYLHHTATVARKMEDVDVGIRHQSELLNRKMNEMLHQLHLLTGQQTTQAPALANSDVNNGYQAPPTQGGYRSSTDNNSFEDVMRQAPLMFASRTYNTSHPGYDANLVRNFPGKIFNMDKDLGNPVYAELKKLIKKEAIDDSQWSAILRNTLEEARSVPHADQVFERKAYVERYIADLEAKYGAYYKPGWVNLEDALFLYWVVRKLKPKTIVQTGVCNGLSSAFMMLALAKNGPDGTLHVVDMPPIFDSTDPNWQVRGKVYGVTIPEGKSSGWLVPDAYQDRFEVLSGDAKDLLPGLLEKVGSIDMFYHDSDHTYDHMMFEFVESKKYLSKNGVIVSDDISWNASLWDFADQYMAPAYNYRGSMGIACF
jgi:predicted O-methyltransferase YrrM